MSKRKRFKGTGQEHRWNAKISVRKLRQHQRDFEAALKQGRCDLALDKLSLHSYESGHYSDSLSYAKGRGPASKRIRSWKRGSVSKILGMKRRFASKCL